MPKNRKFQNIIGTEHITDAAESAIAAQASVGATVAFKNVAVAGQDNVVADAATDTLTLVGGSNVTITTDASADSVTIAAAGGSVGGSDTELLYNDGGTENGIASLTWTDTSGSEQLKLTDESDTALFKIEQTGTGNVFEAHDQASDVNIFKIDNAGKTVIGNSASSTAHSAFQLYVAGDTRLSRLRVGTGSDGEPGVHFEGDSDTGIRRTAADQLGFITGGSERLSVGSSGEILIGGSAAGSDGQVLTSGGAGAAVTWEDAASGGSAFAPTAQVWRSSTNVRNNITGLSPYTQGDDTSSNHPTSLERVFFVPFIAPETVAITKLSVYVSSANANSPNVLFGIYTATDHTATNILQRIPNALQMSATIATATSGYNDGTVSAASGGSTTITQGTLYYLAYAPVASASGYSTLQAWNGRHAPLGVSTGNAIQSTIQYTPYSYGDGLAASYPTTYQAAASITGAAVANVFYRVD